MLVCLCFTIAAIAQVTGGQYAMEYLRLSDAPHVSALGGMNVSNSEQDVSMVFQNPALMRPSLHNELALSNNFYYSDINVMDLQYGYHVEKIKTSFAFGIKNINYGTFNQTNSSGDNLGLFHANDYVVSLAASKSYGERWRYGASLKWAHSNLDEQTASAILADVGIYYLDTANLITFGAAAKNIGFMVKKYNPSNPAEPLPFDMQISASKQFLHLPLRLFATIHHLYEWDVRYDNPADATISALIGNSTSSNSGSNFADKLFRHFIFGAEVVMGKHLTLTVAYNHLHHGELALDEQSGLTGFSFGVGIYLNKFQVHYARSYYYIGGAYNELGLNMALNKLFSIGKTGDNIHWNKEYKDWE